MRRDGVQLVLREAVHRLAHDRVQLRVHGLGEGERKARLMMLGGCRRDVAERVVDEQAFRERDGHAGGVGASGVHRFEAVFVGTVVHDLGSLHAVGAITPFDLGEDRFPGGSQLVAEHHLVERREALGDGELLAVRRVAVVQEAAHHVHFPRFNQVDGILVRTGMHEAKREPRALGDQVEHILHDALVQSVALVVQRVAALHDGHADLACVVDERTVGFGELDGALAAGRQVLCIELVRELGIRRVDRRHRCIQIVLQIASERHGYVVRFAVELGGDPAAFGDVHVTAQHHVGGAVVQAFRVGIVVERQDDAVDIVEIEVVFETANLLGSVLEHADGLAVERARVEDDDIVVLFEADEQGVVRTDGEVRILERIDELLPIVHAAHEVDLSRRRPFHETLDIAVHKLIGPSGVLGNLREPIVEDAGAHAVGIGLADAFDLGERHAHHSNVLGCIPRTADIGRRGNDEDGCCHQQCGHRRADATRRSLSHSPSLLRHPRERLTIS